MPDKRFVPTRRPDPVPGGRILGLDLTDEFAVVKRLRDGLAPSAVPHLAKELDLSETRILALSGIPSSTFHARKQADKPLSPGHSSRRYRVARATAAAEAYFDHDLSAARRWLTGPKVALGGEAPLAFASTPEGSD